MSTTNTNLADVARQAVSLAREKGASEASATAGRTREVEVQWRDGRLDKVSEATTRGLSVQLYVDGRYSAVSTSDLRPEALERFISDSISMTRALARDEYRRLPEPELYEGRSLVDLAIEDPRQEKLTADERQRFARELEAAARSADTKGAILSVTTGFGDSLREMFRVSSNGFEGGLRGTQFVASAEVSVKDADGRRPEESDYAVARFFEDLPDAGTLGRRAGERALGRLGATKGASAVLPMAVDNRAAGRLVSMLLGPMSGSAIQQKRSFLDGKLGQKVGSDLLVLTDEPHVKRGLGSRLFDGEGITARSLPLFEGGTLRSYFIDTYYGRKLKTRPTTGGASNLAWKLGAKGQPALLADLKEGILVTGFLGGNSSSVTGDFSLGIQGFRVRGGKIAEPVSEMNISGNQLDFWKRLVAVGSDPYAYSALRTPTLVFEGVQFAGV
ncbi:TldD/PmbA family protein [Vitiosangium sp. GDMCC 1.1324]|uniref:TldD/PmbA family protein n=1 Tax=Vitiosangium sp. (strain GDMCC 1.1324) TaxID=2138576 RepID=UPI000D389E01|nr:TldD/PmbA family protein [Vitiosangium sp. GDMCC 1.1324]PTL77415.1 TldD/PmbA family protein [Vitiosangium sp. GDMCC 1.1324]